MRKFILSLILVFLAGPARADCTLLSTGETRPEAAIFYNQDFKVFQYCDGTNWRAMLGGGALDPSLATLTDVDDALAPAHADVLTYDSMSGKWVASPGGIGVESDPQVGDVATDDKWCRASGGMVECDQDAPSATSLLSELADVEDVLAPTGGDVLTYDSMAGKWVAGPGGIGVESDPKVGTTTNGNWCVGNGSQVACTASAPVTSETDPKISTLTSGRWCTTNGSIITCTQTAPVLTESDPKVGVTTNGQWCRGNGSAVTCDQSAPVTSETDPQVSATTNGQWCRGNGSAVTCDQSPPTAGVTAESTVSCVAGANGGSCSPSCSGGWYRSGCSAAYGAGSWPTAGNGCTCTTGPTSGAAGCYAYCVK